MCVCGTEISTSLATKCFIDASNKYHRIDINKTYNELSKFDSI